MQCIVNLIKKHMTKTNIRKLCFLLLPLIIQLFVFKSTSTRIPYVLIGAYLPLFFNVEKKKNTNYYFMIGLNIATRFIAITTGLVFVIEGRDFGSYNLTIGVIYIFLGIISGNKMPYSLTGILLLNALGYLYLNEYYLYFTIGFLVFVLIEFFCGTKLQLLAPFSKRAFGLEFANIGIPKGMAVVGLTLCLTFMTVAAISMTEPFHDSYANQRSRYEQKLEEMERIEQSNKNFLDTITEIEQKTKQKQKDSN